MPEGEEEEQGIENTYLKKKKRFPNWVKEIDIPVQEAHRVPNKLDAKSTTPKHVIIKMPKVNDNKRMLKAAREKQS